MSAESAIGHAPSILGRCRAFLRSHPILCLALLTPGIPEYLSGSSSPIGLLIFPPIFGLLLLANLGLYAAGVLLIREARVRWQLGWASVLALGVAYGIAEEGLALLTLFNPHAGPVNPASAGSIAGVNWIWSSQILPFHALYSVALPLFLLELALPEWRARPFLTRRGTWTVVGLYFATISILGVALAMTTYWMGWPVLVGSLLAIGGLILLARALPKDALSIPPETRPLSPFRLFVLGLAVFPAMIVLPALAAYVGVPTILAIDIAPVASALLAIVTLHRLDAVRPTPGLIAFSGGLLLPILALGVFFALRLPLGEPLVFAADGLAVAFLAVLYGRANRIGATPVGGLRALSGSDPPTPLLPVEPARLG